MRWIEATRNFDQKKKKVVILLSPFFLFNPDEIWKKKSLIFFPPSRFLQRVGRRPRSQVRLSPSICTLRLSSSSYTRSACVALVMSGPIRMKMEDKEFRLQVFFHFISNFLHCRKYDGMARRAVEIRSLIFFLFLYLAAWKLDKSLTLVKYHLIPASLNVLMTWFVLSTYFSPL